MACPMDANSFKSGLEATARQHLTNLQHAVSMVQQAIQDKQIPSLDSIPPEVLHTLLITTCAATGCMIMLLPRARKMVMETAEAMLTIVLLLLLIAVVLGMPVGVLYMSYRGLAFLCTSLMANSPMLQGLMGRDHTQAAAGHQPANASNHTA